MNKCIVLDDATDWQQRAEQAEAFAMTLQTQRDAAEAETAQALEALTIARAELTAARAELEAAQAVVDAVTAYFNKRGAAHAMRAGNDDILTMADALAEYGAIEQQKGGAR